MGWFYLVIAGFLEIAWAVGLKYSEGFSNLSASIFTILGMITSFYFLALALKSIPLGTAYAVWTGIGTVGTAVFGIFLFDDPYSFSRLLCILLIITGIVGLKLI